MKILPLLLLTLDGKELFEETIHSSAGWFLVRTCTGAVEVARLPSFIFLLLFLSCFPPFRGGMNSGSWIVPGPAVLALPVALRTRTQLPRTHA